MVGTKVECFKCGWVSDFLKVYPLVTYKLEERKIIPEELTTGTKS
jgi:hypothetical protein